MNIVLLLNGSLGIKILEYVSGLTDHKVVSIFLNSDKKRSPDYMDEVKRVIKVKNLKPVIVSWVEDQSQIENDQIYLNFPTIGVSALFGHVLPEEFIAKFSGGILNLHPSLLPIGRGADPIPWSIIDKNVQGISIHLINQGLDTGDIAFQKEISSAINMNAGDIYDLAIAELYTEFTRCFPKWVNGEMKHYPQEGEVVSSHISSQLNQMRIFQEDEIGTFGDFVRRLQATTFSNAKLPGFKDNMGNIWDVTFRLSNQQRNKP